MRYLLLFSTIIISELWAGASAQAQEIPNSDPEFDQILSLDIDDLTVTSVSKREQKLNDTAAAIYVLTQEELQRAGVNTIPEALRIVPGLQVARVGTHSWAISARGFNGALSNKLLVMIDGRSIYTPVFSGTYWDDQSTPIQDIERIEVIRGPGASLWGANAMNGIINIITKNAHETQGNRLSLTVSDKGGFAEARHGGKLNEDTPYRTYVQVLDSSRLRESHGLNEPDGWYRVRSGFRMDRDSTTSNDSYTFQGDVYGGEQGSLTNAPTLTPPFTERVISDDTSYGGNLLARWNHEISKDSQLSVQASVDHYARHEYIADQHVSTGDLQFQHSVKLNERNNFIWGGGGRVHSEKLKGSFAVSVNDEEATHGIINTFLQNEYALIPNTAYLTMGSKFEYNDFTGFEVEPSARLSWHPSQNQTVWGAVSRAVRTPSVVEDDISLAGSVTPGTPLQELRAFGNPDQESETVIAYELGHRIQPTRNLSFDTALFYNDYDNLLTISQPGTPFISPTTGSLVIPVTLGNLGAGKVYGGEISASWNVNSDWRLMFGYAYVYMDLEVKPGTLTGLDQAEHETPRNQFTLRSYYNLSDTVHWDNTLYFVDKLTSPVSDYLRYDSRIAWMAAPGLELSIIGRNLLDPSHYEFPAMPLVDTSRSVAGQILWKF